MQVAERGVFEQFMVNDSIVHRQRRRLRARVVPSYGSAGNASRREIAQTITVGLLLRQGDKEGALAKLSSAAAAERAIPMEFGPPTLDKPANELLGDVLMELGRAKEARTAYEAAQVLAPSRGQSLLGLARCARALHDPDLASSVEARLAKVQLGAALAAIGH